jgi:hypothetical protein
MVNGITVCLLFVRPGSDGVCARRVLELGLGQPVRRQGPRHPWQGRRRHIQLSPRHPR